VATLELPVWVFDFALDLAGALAAPAVVFRRGLVGGVCVHVVDTGGPGAGAVVEPVEEPVSVDVRTRDGLERNEVWQELVQRQQAAVNDRADGALVTEAGTDEPDRIPAVVPNEVAQIQSIGIGDILSALYGIERLSEPHRNFGQERIPREYPRLIPVLVSQHFPDGVPGGEYMTVSDHTMFVNLESSEDAHVTRQTRDSGRSRLCVPCCIRGEFGKEGRRLVKMVVK